MTIAYLIALYYQPSAHFRKCGNGTFLMSVQCDPLQPLTAMFSCPRQLRSLQRYSSARQSQVLDRLELIRC